MLFDSNIVIYASKPGFDFLDPLFAGRNRCIASLTQIEVLGFHGFGTMTPVGKQRLLELVNSFEILHLSAPIIQTAANPAESTRWVWRMQSSRQQH